MNRQQANRNGPKASSSVAALAREILGARRIPSATYRLQFGPDLTFRDAKALVPYLDELGISDCYASPIFMTCSSDSHGYDICDHTQLNPDLGSEKDFDAFVAALQSRGMGLILDTVPNHMGIGGSTNKWWLDVLENGPSSVYAPLFDIDWQPVTPELGNRVLLPILEDQYGKVLESGGLRLEYEDGAFFVRYGETRLPVAPGTYDRILGHRLEALAGILSEGGEQLQELRSIITAIGHLPSRVEQDPARVAERNREKEVVKRRIAALYGSAPEIRAAVDATLREFNGVAGDPRSFDLLDALIDAQAYRLAFWRVASDEINYRRFFDVNQLAAISVELPEAFEATHELVLRLVAEGRVTGLRIDHADGLRDPARYLRRLQESYIRRRVQVRVPDANDPEGLAEAVAARIQSRLEPGRASGSRPPLYVVAEKILSEGETLPRGWAVYGTTGYDFLNAVNGVFVDGRARRSFQRIYSHFMGVRVDFANLVNAAKKMIMLVSLASEINSLSHRLERIAKRNRRYRDFTLNTLTFAIREVIAALAVYRTYITELSGASAGDRRHIEAAIAEARRRNPRTAAAIFDFIGDTLLLQNAEDFREEERAELVDFVMKFQQITGSVMAKGFEDTAFYVYNRLVSLNEVGGHPEKFSTPVAAFHRENGRRARRWPHSLLATATHDTKRSEDVRARVNVLSEMPREWEGAVFRWGRLNAPRKTLVDGELAPDRNEEYLLYQTLVGAWPLEATTAEESATFRERIASYMLKAVREAKVHTSWVNPNERYERAVGDFVLGVLSEDGDNPFLRDFWEFQRAAAYYGHVNSLAQLLLKLTSPGVPDFYQGTELWDLSLVDPDNRRPVDFAARARLLAGLERRDATSRRVLIDDLLSRWEDGRIKLYVTQKALSFRKAHQDVFGEGSYVPLTGEGLARDHVVAFARHRREAWVLVAVPRLVTRLCAPGRPPVGAAVWEDAVVRLPSKAPASWRNVMTNDVVKAATSGRAPVLRARDLFRRFPVALLSSAPE